MNRDTHGAARGRGWDLGGMIAVAVTYVFFLLYAQFGFVSLLKEGLGGFEQVGKAMGAMGLAGIVSSLLTAVALKSISGRRLLLAGFSGCALTALVSTHASSLGFFLVIAGLIGACTAMLTVVLASEMRAFIRGPGFGWKVGTATGIAYFICNIPPVFEASPELQSHISAVACLCGWVAVLCSPHRLLDVPMRSPGASLRRNLFHGVGFGGIVLTFLALIWLDSAAFATIQETAGLKGHTWGSGGQKMLLGIVHLLAASAAGWLIDRGWFRSLLVLAFGLLAVAFAGLNHLDVLLRVAGPLYATGISLYSVALVIFPSLHGDERGLVPSRWRAGVLFGVAGWIGSGLGIGMAQHLHHLPPLLTWAAGGAVLAGWVLGWDRARQRQFVRVYGLPLAMGCAAMVHFGVTAAHRPVEAAGTFALQDESTERGRRVYIQEGCINCHSQYIRPRTHDVELWGPFREVDFSETPPMIGNRRQGPDLMNVGIRRSRAWQRIHLVDPSSVSPGSRMPAYTHLFRGIDTRGDDLVNYLDSLGPRVGGERVAFIQQWCPRESGRGPDAERGKAVFERSCSACHGAEGRGDGPVAEYFARPTMDLLKGEFAFVPPDVSTDEEAEALARIIKFGIVGTSMPGHEYFADHDILSVVAYIQELTRRGREVVAARGRRVTGGGGMTGR